MSAFGWRAPWEIADPPGKTEEVLTGRLEHLKRRVEVMEHELEVVNARVAQLESEFHARRQG